MSRFLRALAYVAPKAALNRAFALQSLRGYDAAQNGRRTTSFRRGAQSANGEIGPSLATLRARSSELVQNSFIGPRTLDVLVAHTIGTDMSVRFSTGNKKADRLAQALWDRWVAQCDITRETSFTGLVALAFRSSLERGDSIIRMLPRPMSDERVVPFALAVCEGDMIDETRDIGAILNRTNRARLGVELGNHDERIGYWLHHNVPGEPVAPGAPLQSFLAPRADVCHLYRRLRPGQVRGVPVFAPVLLTARDYADLMDAVVVAAGMEANMGLIVKSMDQSLTMGQAVERREGRTSQDNPVQPLTELAPGMLARLQPGEDIEAFQPATRTALDPVARRTLMAIAAGCGITYDQLTGDLTGANYSSLKAGKIEFRRMVADLQWHMLVPQVIDRIVDRFVALAIASGRLPSRADGYPRVYVMPAHEPIDPKKDLEADILAVRSGRMSPQDFVGAWGRDWRVVLAEWKEFMAEADSIGAIFDIDARQRSRAGQETGTTADSADPQSQDITA